MSESTTETASVKREQPRRSLKRFLLNPQYQLRYIYWMTIAGLISIFLQTTVFYKFIQDKYLFLVDLSPMSAEAKLLLYDDLHHMLIVLAGTSLLFIILISILGLVLSHRTVGPLYHFKRVFEAIKNGNRSERIRLRSKDNFQEVAKAFNEMMDSIK